MKKLTTLILGCSMVLISCEMESLEQKENLDSLKLSYSESSSCLVLDADRCPFTLGGESTDQQPIANMWWPEFENDYFEPSAFFGSTDNENLQFIEYADGTARIYGTTVQVDGGCSVTVDVWLKNRKTWEEWLSIGGGHKKEGCAGDASNETEMSFYVIDSGRSTLTATGENCLGEGTFGLEQRPDPNDDSTPNFGAHVGPGGANYDSDKDALGLSTWGWITDISTGERLWIMDFNFKIDCEIKEPQCETAFAFGGDQEECFLNYGFNRWGWSIGPLSEGDYTYDIYAGAGQCDIAKGEKVGTINVSYSDGDVNFTYNIDPGYTIEETHSYAGNNMFPSKKKKGYTVAPGQYTIQENLEGEIFIIAHAVVCN